MAYLYRFPTLEPTVSKPFGESGEAGALPAGWSQWARGEWPLRFLPCGVRRPWRGVT